MRHPNVLDLYHGDNREKIPDFRALKAAGILAIIHKATQGTGYIDKTYANRAKAATDAGLLVGAYHYMDGSDPDTQADHFLSTIGINSPDWPPNMLLAVDYEDNGRNSAALHQLYAFMKYVDQNTPPGFQIALYSGNRIRETLKPHVGGHIDQSMVGVEDFFAKHRLWLAEYGPHENIPYPWNNPGGLGVFLWQYEAIGHVNPIVGNVDLNYFAGTVEQLTARWSA